MKKLSIQDAQNLALNKNGLCVSDEYVNSKEKLKWECNAGHQWEARIANIQQGGWCPKCCRKKPSKYDLEYVQKFAKQIGGICLSEVYEKTIDVLKWKCEKGHVWQATFHDIKKGTWCPDCATEKKRVYDIDYCKKLASKLFGECISEEYRDTKTKLHWRCELGHTWDATLGNVKDNESWCPQCSQSYGESKFREVIEKITGCEFPKTRPSWLLNERGNRMEIDGFCSKLKIGFEYQGRQHLEFIPHWHKKILKFNEQQKADSIKRKILDDRGIKMIYPTYKLKPYQFEDFIKNEICMIDFQNKANLI